ncbi:MAG: anti-sigma factor [Pyrinomonadaceae bacterium]
MMRERNNIVDCSTFEELLTDYLDKTLDPAVNRSVAAHALACPLCHSLLNDVKVSLEVCRTITAPTAQMTRLEARVLSMTMPETSMPCEEFEEHLTDYLDGFLPASRFHHWERHAALCNSCEDLPGMVVRSIAACYTYKMDELAVPSGLHERILNLTLGAEKAAAAKASWVSRAGDWVRGLGWPVAVPQLAPVAMMFGFAFLVFSQTVSADGSLAGVYQKSFELAEQTYQQSAEAWNGRPGEAEPVANRDPITGTTTVGNEE